MLIVCIKCDQKLLENNYQIRRYKMKTLKFSLLILIIFGANYSVHAENNNSRVVQRSESDIARDKTSKPKAIMAFLGIKKGDHVLDFLGGSGYYSQLIATAVGSSGKVVLHTNQAYMKFVGKELAKRKASGGLDNVTQLLSEADDLKLGTEQFDTAILVLGYHDFFYKKDDWDFPADTVMPQLHKSLKKGGQLLIIDHDADKNSGISVIESLHRIEGSYVMEDILQRDFKFVKESNLLQNDQDSLNILVFDPKIRRKTSRFVYLFEKI